MARKGLTWDDGGLLKNLRTFDARADKALTAAIGYHAPQAATYAKINAPWTDQTTNARNGLGATPQRVRMGTYRIIVHHSVPYGLYLETRWAGKYKVIMPTVNHEGDEVMKTIGELFKLMGM